MTHKQAAKPMFPDWQLIEKAAFDAYEEATVLDALGDADYRTPIVSLILIERMRCMNLALQFASGTPRDTISALVSYEMEELLEHIRDGEFKKRKMPDNDNDDMV